MLVYVCNFYTTYPFVLACINLCALVYVCISIVHTTGWTDASSVVKKNCMLSRVTFSVAENIDSSF